MARAIYMAESPKRFEATNPHERAASQIGAMGFVQGIRLRGHAGNLLVAGVAAIPENPDQRQKEETDKALLVDELDSMIPGFLLADDLARTSKVEAVDIPDDISMITDAQSQDGRELVGA